MSVEFDKFGFGVRQHYSDLFNPFYTKFFKYIVNNDNKWISETVHNETGQLISLYFCAIQNDDVNTFFKCLKGRSLRRL